MPIRSRRRYASLLTVATIVATVGGAAPLASAAAEAGTSKTHKARTLYVSAAAAAGGSGSRRRPLASLQQVEQVSRRGDTVIVLPAPAETAPLDGGIKLKPRQRLIGGGPRLISRHPPARAARITNSSGARNSGDAVTLADGAIVKNLEIGRAWRGAIYGGDVSGVRIEGNEVWGHNRSCTKGFLIPPFNAPTNVPGVGLPISGGLQNGWAGIMLDAASRSGKIAIRHNLVRDARCGDGIDIRLRGTARYQADITSNMVHHLQEGPDFQSLLAIGMQTKDHAQLVARLDRNEQTELGNPGDPNLLVAGADSEGVFVNPDGPSSIDATIRRNTYTNPRALGGFSANGMEAVTMGRGGRAKVHISDSTFSGSTGDVFEEGALGTDATLDLTLDNVLATRSVGFGNTGVLPFNNSDCLLAGSLGARNTINLAVRRSSLTNCANNGLSLGSNVVNGSGPTTAIHATVDDSVITGNHGGNIGIRNFTGLGDLSVRVQNSNLSDSRGNGSALANVAAEDLGDTTRSVIDLGGGALGSAGQNCIAGGVVAADVIRYRVGAARNWWGPAGGPGLGRTLVVGGSLDTGGPLSAPPASCARR